MLFFCCIYISRLPINVDNPIDEDFGIIFFFFFLLNCLHSQHSCKLEFAHSDTEPQLDLTEVNQPPMLIISKVMFCFWANLQSC